MFFYVHVFVYFSAEFLPTAPGVPSWTTAFDRQKGPFQAGSLLEVCVTQKQQTNSSHLNIPTSDSRVQKCLIFQGIILHISENGLLSIHSVKTVSKPHI